MNISIPSLISATKEKGETFEFLNREYMQGKKVKLKIGDEVIIHPAIDFDTNEHGEVISRFISQATKSYPAKITAKEMKWCKGNYPDIINCPKMELCLQGIGENKKWHGAVLNEYGFGRLQFVQRSFWNTILEMFGLG